MSSFEIALTGQALVWLLVIGVFLLTGQASIYHPLTVYLVFHGVVFVLRPLLVHYAHFDREWIYMGFEPTDQQQMRALAASSLGLMVLSAASLAFGWSAVRFQTATPAPFTREQNVALWVVTALLLPVIAYSIGSLMGGGMQVENRGTAYVMVGASGYTLEAQYMAGPLICLWLAVKRFRWPVVLPIIPYVLYRSYAGMSRWTIVLLFIALALVYAWQKRLKWLPVWAIVGLIPVLLIFRTIGNDRQFFGDLLTGEEISRPATTDGLTAGDKWRASYDDPDFANYDYLTFVTAMVPERTGTHTYGSQYLQLFTEPIPRKLWPGKPVGAPIGSFNLNDYGNFFGLTISLAGDGWVSGGWLGVFVTMAIVGAVLGCAHRWFWRNSGSNMVSLYYLVGMAMLPQWYRDGGISIAKFLFWNLSPLVVWSACTWLLGSRLVPVASVIVARGTSARLMQVAATNVPDGAMAQRVKAGHGS